MAQILLIYASTDGHTRDICLRLKEVISSEKIEVTLLDIQKYQYPDLRPFDMFIIGASIRYGKHSSHIIDFINKNEDILTSKESAFFSVNVVARKPNKNTPTTNPYMKKFLRKTSWCPKKLAVFAGKINYPKYGTVDRFIIRLIMLVTGGPTDPKAVVDFTDWHQVESFGRMISELYKD